MKRLIHPSGLAGKDPAAITAEDIVLWQDWALIERQFSVADVRKGQTVLSRCFTWAAKRPSITGVQGNPVRSAGWPKYTRQHDPQF